MHGDADIARGVNALIHKRVEEGCERAWSELGDAFRTTLFPSSDPSSVSARAGVCALIEDLADELTRVALAALLLPPVSRAVPASRSASNVVKFPDRTGANGTGRRGTEPPGRH